MARLTRFSAFSQAFIQGGFMFGDFRLEPDGALLRGQTPIHLPPKELAALQLLLEHEGQIVTHQQLKTALWGDVHVTADSVPKCLSSLREKLQADEDVIQTVYKRGYRIATQVRRMELALGETLPRLAIMPFSNGPNVAAHLGSAVAEETIALLTGERLLPAHLLARDSVFTLAARGLTAQQVGEKLEADLVLTGTVRLLPRHFRLRAEMVRVADGTQVWVEDLLVPQERIAGMELELARRLLVRLSNGGLTILPEEPYEAGEENSFRREAYELFLRGHHECKTLQRHRMQDGLQHLMRAIELDPTLTQAHIDVAHASIAQAFYGFMSPALAAEQVRMAANAVSNRGEGADAILPALGWVRFHVDHDLTGALRAFKASAHLPHDCGVTRVRSMFALSRLHFDEAITTVTAALRADPYAPWLNARLAWAYHLAGEAEKSLEQVEKTLEIFPDHEEIGLYGAVVLAYNGQAERAMKIAENLVRRSPYFDLATAVQGYTLVCGGRRDEAQSILERLQWLSRERFVLSSFTPALCVALGDLDGAIAELNASMEARCPWFFMMLADPRLTELHGRAEFQRMQKILEKMETAAEKHLSRESDRVMEAMEIES